MKSASLLASAVLSLGLTGTASANVLLYANDFDDGEYSLPGIGVSALSNGALEATATYGDWSGNYFANRTLREPSSLTLSNLAPHSTVTVNFMLGFLESWDSRDGGCCAPDNLDFYVDGVLVASFTANNALGSIEDFGGGTIVGHYVQANSNTFHSDTIVDMSTAPALTFSHSASTLTLALRASGAGWQGDTDEAWGVDAIRITYDATLPPVPEPSTWALMLAGSALLFGAARRRVR